ncbi:PPOX class F420-dependent oxidoreductase [Pseudonocardiaceae bacterium YIM PH 21723]|nr:PPOX class F420-dependent oxidoreductase [Pseudonocardiaceae bacterium YIM PH 21723]
MGDLERLSSAKYVLVTTYRKNGTAVPTPVWSVVHEGKLAIWTVTDSWKVKRIRNNPQVTVAECTMRGEPTSEAVPGTARVLDDQGASRVRGLINRKYGLAGMAVSWGSVLRRGKSGTVGIEISLDPTS